MTGKPLSAEAQRVMALLPGKTTTVRKRNCLETAKRHMPNAIFTSEAHDGIYVIRRHCDPPGSDIVKPNEQ